MKKLLALVLSMLLVASCFAMMVSAEEETTAAAEETTVAEGETTAAEGETTAAEGETTAAGEETTEEATNYSNTLLVFNEDAKGMKILSAPNGINKTLYKSDWEGARLAIKDVGDPYITINWSNYIKKGHLEDVDSQEYPFIVFKMKVVGYIDDVELFFCAGDVRGADPAYAATTDYPCVSSGEVEYIIYDLTGDCEGIYNQFRFDPMGADEDTEIYLYELAMFKTEDEALKYAGYDETEEEPTTEPAEEETTEEETEEETKAPAKTEKETEPAKEEGCGGIISVGAVVAMIALGVVCIKKKD